MLDGSLRKGERTGKRGDLLCRHLAELIACCPPMTALAALLREFAGLLTRRRGHDLHA